MRSHRGFWKLRGPLVCEPLIRGQTNFNEQIYRESLSHWISVLLFCSGKVYTTSKRRSSLKANVRFKSKTQTATLWLERLLMKAGPTPTVGKMLKNPLMKHQLARLGSVKLASSMINNKFKLLNTKQGLHFESS